MCALLEIVIPASLTSAITAEYELVTLHDLGAGARFRGPEMVANHLEHEIVRGQGASPQSRFRIEHGGIIPPNYTERIVALDAWVVTNPGFIYHRGEKYVSEPGLIPYLYRARTLMSARPT